MRVYCLLHWFAVCDPGNRRDVVRRAAPAGAYSPRNSEVSRRAPYWKLKRYRTVASGTCKARDPNEQLGGAVENEIEQLQAGARSETLGQPFPVLRLKFGRMTVCPRDPANGNALPFLKELVNESLSPKSGRSHRVSGSVLPSYQRTAVTQIDSPWKP